MGHYVSADTRMKMSLSRRGDKHAFYGKHLSESTKEKIRIANTGRQQSEATKHKISVKNIEAWKRRKRKGKRSPNKE